MLNGVFSESSGSGISGEHFLQARCHFRQWIRVQPFAPDPKAWNRMGADERFAGGELDEFLALPMIEPVRPGVGIKDPVFLDAVLLIGGELRSDIHFIALGHHGRHGGKLVPRRGGRKQQLRRWFPAGLPSEEERWERKRGEEFRL